MPVILLVLGGVHTGVVGGDDHKTAGHTVVSGGEQGISRHVHAHVLHGAEAAHAGDGSAVSHLRSHLLVGRPLTVKVARILGQCFKNLCAGGAGIGRAHPDARLVGAPGNGFVAG